MAGVVNGVQQVVSSCPATDSGKCDAFDLVPDLGDVVDNFSFSANTNNDLLAPNPTTCADTDLSLQDLIDSELALRIKADKTEVLVDLNNDEEVEEAESEESQLNSVERRPIVNGAVHGVANGVVNGNLVTDFLDSERSHADLTEEHAEQDNSLSLSLSLSSNAAPLCSGEGDDLDMTSELGSDGPADSDFSPNVPDQAADAQRGFQEEADLEPDLLADEATLAEDISLASERSQERTGSLLDLDPLRPDSPPGSGPGPGSTSPTGLRTSPGASPGTSRGTSPTGFGLLDAEPAERELQLAAEGEEGRRSSPLGPLLGPCSEESGAVLSAAAAAEQQQHLAASASISVPFPATVVDDALESASPSLDADDVDDAVNDQSLQQSTSPVLPTTPCVDANQPAPRVVNNSMDVFPSAVPPAGDPSGFEDGFETWSTVEEVVAQVGENTEAEALAEAPLNSEEAEVESGAQISYNSDSETVSETSEKKTVSKKKKVDGAETTKKRTKKSKKSDGKENISVLTNGHGINGHVEKRAENVNGINNIPHSNGYADHAVVEDDLSNVCVKDLKSAYATLTKTEVSKEVVKDLKDIDHDIMYCGPIKNLRRSFGDLRNCENSENGAQFPPDEEICNDGKSSFSKFDQLSKKTVLHVRSVDASKVQKQFNESASTSPEAQSNCKACGKQVFVMEQIKAEKAVWHKNCFRCKECSKQLTVDTYSSNDGDIFCKPHFRELFKPKAVVEDSPEPIRRRKHELIIRENQPLELPPDVVRASDKPDLGLEELSSLNVKSRFQVFEKTEENKSLDIEKSPSNVNVKRSPSILSKLAKFQAKGMDIGVTDESLNGIPYEESSTSSEEEEDDGEGDEENGDIVKSRRTARERPMSFSKMEDVKSRWETGSATKKEERREERKQEISTIRSRLFLGKQGKMKEMYEQAVKESEQPAARRGAEVRSEKAKSIKEKFERGETLVSDEEGDENDKKMKDDGAFDGVFEAGISKKSRSLFLELDASAAKTAQQTPPRQVSQAGKDGTKKREVLTNQVSSEVVKASDKVEDAQAETADVSSKFKFFETYKAPEKQRKAFRITPPREGQVKMDSPEREVYRDPDVVRAEDPPEGDELQHSMTTSKMLSIFRQMEEKAQREDVPDGPKPLKCFTPPPDYKPESGSSEDDRSDEDEEEDDEEEEEEDDDGVIRSSVKAEDEFLKAAKEAAKAKTLRAKFEHWEEQENNINAGGGNINPTLLESEHESIESTKSLRARFESLRKESEAPKEKPRPKVNRFVEIQTSCAEYCDSCEKKVYPLEKVETGGKLFHKGCFRCMQCSCILRMESYTLNNGKLYCIPHFKQLFISKGNYDEGFGLDQHKRKWNSTRENGDILLSGIDANGNNH
ncbi:uncharacterized protein LOC113208097 isoform X9 [Frankliniella occidentalis]|uniref:Uncharacterized protein LOC113208097 isoform X9 n=1 Tax=Frankliniella occidentalis TaxID=133901 RepID=A0A9C6X9E6_FRAOC|nr:uncharacterized protein LOC113208097 isoform X9 [Frankliniella occidentalis]